MARHTQIGHIMPWAAELAIDRRSAMAWDGRIAWHAYWGLARWVAPHSAGKEGTGAERGKD